MKTMFSHWKTLALVLAFVVGTATLAAAQEMIREYRTVAEIQAEINQLQLELQDVLATKTHVLTAEQKTQSKQEHMSVMFRDFPRLLSEQRYEEALVMAQKAKFFAPDDPNIRVMEDVAIQIYNIRRKHLRSAEEDMSQIRQRLIIQQLETPIALNVDSPLSLAEALNLFCGHLDIPWILELSLTDPVSADTLVHIPQGYGINLQMKTVLDLLLDPLGLAYVIKDEQLHITTKGRAQGKLLFRVYYLGDIKNYAGLAEIIPAVVAPDSWDAKGLNGENGERGALQAHPEMLSVAIRQTEGVHSQIEEFLMQVRQANEIRQASR